VTIEHIIKSSLEDWTEDVPVPLDLSSAALKQSRRRRSAQRLIVAPAVLVLAAAAAVSVPMLTASHGHSVRAAASPRTVEPTPTVYGNADPQPTAPPPNTVVSPPRAPAVAWTPLPLTQSGSGNTTISAHVNESPPVHLIAADDVAVSAYYLESHGAGGTKLTWYLYNTGAAIYERTAWSFLDVEPGLGLAAVIPSIHPETRIGIVDMATGNVIRWIPTDRPVGIVRFAPDGTKLVATTYDGDPGNGGAVTGFIIVDLTNGYQTDVRSPVGDQHSFPAGAHWTYNGAYVFLEASATAQSFFYTASGQLTAPPAHADALSYEFGNGANVSPDGTLAVTDRFPGSPTGVVQLASGSVAGTQPVESLEGWANNSSLIAWGCAPGCSNENHQRLVLVSLDGKDITPLTGYVQGKTDVSPDQWRVLLTSR
jgi:hypothetical protein